MPVQGAEGLTMLAVSATVMGRANVIHPTLMWDEKTAILVDTGFPGQLPLLGQAVEQAGIPLARLNKVILTHQDLDHIGGLPDLLKETRQPIEVLAGAAERPYIQGEKRLVKLTPGRVARWLDSLPAGTPEELRRALAAVLEHPPQAAVDKTVADGEVLPYCGGITVISTPGHTPGHICLYHRPSRTLVAGDALAVADGRLVTLNRQLNLDTEEAGRSLQKLTRYDVGTVICYHGGLYRDDANRRIAEIARTFLSP